MTVPKISVIMPVYNAESFLKESISSILNQSFKDFEFLIMNDGSTDKSLDIIKQYATNDSRIKIFSQKNQGIVAALNNLLINAKSDLIARMDADDISDPHRLEKQYDYLQKNHGTVLLGTKCRILGTPAKSNFNNIFISDTLNRWFLCMNSPFIHSSVMMRKAALIKSGKYESLYYPAEDYHLWIKIKRFGKIENLPEKLLTYRLSEGITLKNLKNQINKRDQLNKINFEDIFKHKEIPEIRIIEDLLKKENLNKRQKFSISRLCALTGCFLRLKKDKNADAFFKFSLQLSKTNLDSLFNLLFKTHKFSIFLTSHPIRIGKNIYNIPGLKIIK